MKQPYRIVGALVVLVWVLSSCNRATTFPAISTSESNTFHHGSVVWRDLIVHSEKDVLPFYKNVFGWEIEQSFDASSRYYLVKSGNRPIAGIWAVDDKRGDSGGEWLPFISVENASATADLLRIMGGATLGNTFDMKGRGKAAIVRDPQQAMFGILANNSGDPEPQTGINEFIYTELWAEDPLAVARFYSGLGFGFQAQSERLNPYYSIEHRGHRIAGAIKNPMLETRSFWVSYISVNNLTESIEKVRKHGGSIFLEPTPEFREGRTAICADPSGAPFLLQKGPVSLKTSDSWHRNHAACEDC